MNTITSSDALSAHVRGYAQAVRLHLPDRAPAVPDDLTDGLEADLTEAVLDQAAAPADGTGTQVFDLVARFGPADEYATELRTSAGLPPSGPAARTTRGPARVIGETWTVLSERWRAAWRPLTSTPGWAAVAGFALSLAPAWWILRGWVGAQIILVSFTADSIALWPGSNHGRIVVVAAIVVSVQWGRGRWVPRWAWFPPAVAVASVAAGILAIPLVAIVEADARPTAVTGSSYETGWNDGFYSAQIDQASGGGESGTDGVWVDGMQISNLFAYDAAGNPIRDVQLFDDRGRPVRTITDDATWNTWSVPDVVGEWSFQPATATDGRARWNVFPLRAVPAEYLAGEDDTSYGTESEGYPAPPTGVQPREMPWPFLKAPTMIEKNAGAADLGSGPEGSTAPEESDSDRPGGDRPMSSTDREPVHPGERPASDSGFPEPTLEATQAD